MQIPFPTIETFPTPIKAGCGRSRSYWDEPFLILIAVLFWAIVLPICVVFSLAAALGGEIGGLLQRG